MTVVRPKQHRSSQRSTSKLLGIVFFSFFTCGLLFFFFSDSKPQQQSSHPTKQLQVAPQGDKLLDAARASGCRDLLSSRSPTGKIYSVVFDIGSTGNRVHVFRFRRQETGPKGCAGPSCLVLEDELFVDDHNSLSHIKDPQKCVETLRPLYDKALAYVPEAVRACTLVEFKATAGLRKIGKDEADRILSAIQDYYGSKDFWLRGGSEACRIMDGKDEGPMAWLTVNFLHGSFRSLDVPTVAIIDLGGGSTQIVFEPKDTAHIHRSFLFEQKIGDRYVKAYQHSYDGYGLHEGVQALLCRVAGTCSSSIPLTPEVKLEDERQRFPCFAGGYTDEASQIQNMDKEINFKRCTALFNRVVLHPTGGCEGQSCGIGQVYQPSLREFNDQIYAFSFIYDLMKEFLTENGVLTPADIAAAGEKKCRDLTLQSISERPQKISDSSLLTKYECLYYAYVYALLTNGYGIPEDRKLHVAKKIDGFETAWALGAGIMSISKLQ